MNRREISDSKINKLKLNPGNFPLKLISPVLFKKKILRFDFSLGMFTTRWKLPQYEDNEKCTVINVAVCFKRKNTTMKSEFKQFGVIQYLSSLFHNIMKRL